MAYSKQYSAMIYKLYEALKANAANWVVPKVWQQDPWSAFVQLNPLAKHTLDAVEGRENYELSHNQRCVATSTLLNELVATGQAKYS